jgi:hypothetical protein
MITLTREEGMRLADLIPVLNASPHGFFEWITVMENHENWTFKVVTVRYPGGEQDEWILTDQGFTRLNEAKR